MVGSGGGGGLWWEKRWKEAFRLWDLTLVAFCSLGEILVSTVRRGTLPVPSSVLDVLCLRGFPGSTEVLWESGKPPLPPPWPPM